MYRITIQKVENIESIKNGEWTVVDKRPYTHEELAQTGDIDFYKQELKEIRDYTPNQLIVKEVTREVYKQEIDDLNLFEVIKAVNGETLDK